MSVAPRQRRSAPAAPTAASGPLSGYPAPVWVARHLERLLTLERPVALLGGEGAGVPFLLDALRAHERVAWFHLTAAQADDAVAQGNALAAAVNRTLGAPLLPTALPIAAHLSTLERHRADVLPLALALTLEHPVPTTVDALLALHAVGYRVILDVRGETAPLRDALARCLLLSRAALAVSAEEARAAAPAALSDAEVERLRCDADAAFGTLLGRLNAAAGVPRPLVPAPDGWLVDRSEAELVEPQTLLGSLVRQGQLIEALEFAALSVSQAVDELLRDAGPRYQGDGLLARLHLLLSALPEPYRLRERVLEWRLVAALAVGEVPAVAPDVDAHLERYHAPSLRARRAGTLPHSRGFVLAEQALRAARTPLTLWQYGRLHPDPAQALDHLHASVRLAEEVGGHYEVVRSAGAYGVKLVHAGEFARGAAWLRWALDVFDQAQLRDGARRLLLSNDLAVARIMCGDLVGVRGPLEDALAMADAALPSVATLLRSTLAWFELAEGQPTRALEHMQAVYRASGRALRARYAYQLVRVLNELGQGDEALRVADDAVAIAEHGEPHERLEALLARGMARAAASAAGSATVAAHDGGRDDLLAVVVAAEPVMEQRLAAALHLLLVSDGAAHLLPAGVSDVLAAMPEAAARVLSGPARCFEGVWATLRGATPALELSFLGAVTCRWQGREVVLARRLAEAAFALVLHPDGIGRDQLNDFLTGEARRGYAPSAVRALMTRLRALLPVSDAPYRFEVPFRCDVGELRDHLTHGRIRPAVALLRGRLLPESDAPGVDEVRLVLEEELRQAALQAADPDALFELSERLGDDLECWEATVAALAPGDPRVALARARVRRLERAYGVA